jgi:hypothetical protein
MEKKKKVEEIEATETHWHEIFGLGRFGPLVEIDHKKMLRFPGHVFFHRDMIF